MFVLKKPFNLGTTLKLFVVLIFSHLVVVEKFDYKVNVRQQHPSTTVSVKT